jgi:putative sigma-54 modulation protein
MKVKIQSVKFDADKKLIEYIEKKLVKLERFHDSIILAEVTLSFENAVKESNKKVAIRLEAPGGDLFADRAHATFEHAYDLALDALKNQISKQKEKY